jgi:hypothetical protein
MALYLRFHQVRTRSFSCPIDLSAVVVDVEFVAVVAAAAAAAVEIAASSSDEFLPCQSYLERAWPSS